MRIRSILFYAAAFTAFLVIGIVCAPLLLLPERFVWPVVRIWARSSLYLHRTIAGIGEEILGKENIPEGGLLVASKHQSAWETLRLAALLDRPTFILKQELMWIPVFGWYLKRTGQIPIRRGQRSAALAAMTRHALAAIARGRQVIIFPEGTRRPPLAAPQYRYGVTRLYLTLGAPCLPVAHNAGLFWPRRELVHRAGHISLSVLPPIAPGLPADRFTELLRSTIEAESDRLAHSALERYPDLRKALAGDIRGERREGPAASLDDTPPLDGAARSEAAPPDG